MAHVTPTDSGCCCQKQDCAGTQLVKSYLNNNVTNSYSSIRTHLKSDSWFHVSLDSDTLQPIKLKAKPIAKMFMVLTPELINTLALDFYMF